MRSLCLLALLAAALAGCSGDAGDETTGTAEPETPPAPAATNVVAYEFTGTVTGSSPPDPMGQGGASDLPLAKADSFEAPAGATKLSYQGSLSGAGSGRVEVYAPDGTLAYRSETYTACAVVVCVFDTTTSSEPAVLPGSYEVRYYVAGSMDVEVRASASVPAAPQPA